MNKERISKFINQSILTLILGIIFFLPIYLNPLVSLSFQKAHFFRLSAEVLFLLFLAKGFVLGEFHIKKNTFFYLSLFFFFFAQLTATFFSPYPYISFWGSFARQIGFFTWIHVYFFIFIVFNFFNKDNLKIKNIFFTVASSGLIVGLYAIIQASGLDFFDWTEAQDGRYQRVISTLGQPNFLAAFLLFVLPPTLYLCCRAEKNYQKILAFIFFAAQFVAFILTYSRSAWLGLGIVIIFFASASMADAPARRILLFWRKKNKRIVSVVLLLLFISIFAFFSLVHDNSDEKKLDQLSVAGRLKSLADFKEGSAGLRGYYYRAALDIIKKSPIIGHGLDTQGFYYYKYYDKNYAIAEKINAYPDRAHNELLDILITTGILGFAAWMFFFFIFIKQSRQFFKVSKNKKEISILIALIFPVLSLSLALLFGFFTETDLVYFWFYITIIFIFFSPKEELLISLPVRRDIKIIFLTAMLILLVFLSWEKNIKPQIADYYYRQSQVSRLGDDFNKTVYYGSLAIDYAPREMYFRNSFVIDNLPLVLSLEDVVEKKSFLLYLKEALVERGMENFTLESRAFLAILLSELGKIELEGGRPAEAVQAFKESEKIFAELTKESPEMSRLHLDFGTMYFNQKEYDKAEAEYNKALLLYPDLENKKMNAEHRDYVVSEMALVYEKINDINYARKNN